MKIISVLMTLAVTTSGVMAQAQEDTSGKGAVLCVYQLLAAVKWTAKGCAWDRTASDDAIDQALEDIEVFVRKNASTPEPIKAMEALKVPDVLPPIPSESLEQCAAFDKQDRGSTIAFLWMWHTRTDLEHFRAEIADTLSEPREPLALPCL